MAQKDTYLDVLDELRDLTLKKRAGYSPGDDPYKNFRMSQTFGIDPVKGIMIRVMDKIARIASLLENPANDQVAESLRDTMLDAGNYLLIAVAYQDAERLAEVDSTVEQIMNEIDAEREAVAEQIMKGHDCAEAGCTFTGRPFDTSQVNAQVGLFDSSDALPPGERVRFGPDPEDVEFLTLDEMQTMENDFFPCCDPNGCMDCDDEDDCLSGCPAH